MLALMFVVRSAEELSKLENKYFMQNSLIDSLKRDNERLVLDAKDFQKQCIHLQKEIEQNFATIQKKQNEINRLRILLNEKDRELSKKILDTRTLVRMRGGEKAADEEIRKILEEKDATIERLEKQLMIYEGSPVLSDLSLEI